MTDHDLGVKLKQPLIRLPVRFCAETLAAEIRALPPEAWIPHPRGFEGNEAVPLITPHGLKSDEFIGPMEPTEFLKSCPYISEIMAHLDSVWGRSRLMGLAPGADVPPHIDIKYYWRTHIRVHVPIITNPGVRFTCGGETVHMAAGDCWVLDTFRQHTVHNGGTEQRIHLVLDTVGSARLWELVELAATQGEPVLLPPGMAPANRLRFEQYQAPRIMSPWELRCHIDQILGYAVGHPMLGQVRAVLDRFVAEWFGAWAEYRDEDAGIEGYREMVDAVRADLVATRASDIRLGNGLPLARVLEVLLFGNAVAPDAVRDVIDQSAEERQRLAG